MFDKILNHLANRILSPSTKLALAKYIIAEKIIANIEPQKSILPLLSFLEKGNSFDIEYCKNYLRNYSECTSQIGLDCFVDTYFHGKTDGFFIEIGVGNGISLSNTCFLEKHRNWTGILCEPCKEFYKPITKTRTSKLIRYAIHPISNKTIMFTEHIDSRALSTCQKNNIPDHEIKAIYPVKTINFNDLMETYARRNTIDYLSIDIEGGEWEILMSIDFQKYDIKVLSIEHNKDFRLMNQYIEYLKPLGYKYYDNNYFDWDIVFYK